MMSKIVSVLIMYIACKSQIMLKEVKKERKFQKEQVKVLKKLDLTYSFTKCLKKKFIGTLNF